VLFSVKRSIRVDGSTILNSPIGHKLGEVWALLRFTDALTELC
jgi:hypothetical protein